MNRPSKKALDALSRELKAKTADILAAHGFDEHELKSVTLSPKAEATPGGSPAFACHYENGHLVCG